jgi:hypothetical protein
MNYLVGLSLDVYLLCVGTCGATDAGVVNTLEHEHLIVGFIAQVAYFADIHCLR